MPRARMASHWNRHDANRPRARNQHILAQYRKRKRGMNCIAKGIEDRRHLLVDTGMVPPDVGHRQGDIFGKRAGAIHPYTLRIGAEMPPAGHAVTATSADYVPLAADDVAGIKIVHIRPDLDH